MLWNIDFDGVLIPNTNENLLLSHTANNELSFEDTSPLWDWYGRLIKTNPLPLDNSLLGFLSDRKNEGDTIRLWTNRAYTLRGYTLNNLGDYKSLFDSFQFYDGRKHLSQVEGIVVDNSPEYLHCGEEGILYQWKGGDTDGMH